MKTKIQSGFTLIELLVVISIISLLSSVVLASVKTGREKAVLAKTVSEMKSLQLSIELYKNQFGTYPGTVNQMYSDSFPSQGLWNGIYPNSLETLENNFLISNKLLANPILAPKLGESCDSNCATKGYELFYSTRKDYGPSFNFRCGGVPVENYIIFFIANSKKINLPFFTMIDFTGTTEVNGGNAFTLGTLPYTYCIAG